jgi:hypothetical protein
MVAKRKRGKIKEKAVKNSKISPEKNLSKKIRLVLTSLISSLIVFAFAWIGYNYLFLQNLLIGNFFFILSYVSGYISVAFFMALIILVLLKVFRK